MQTVLPSEEDLKKKLFHKQSNIISDQQKFPQLFRWKTATLILGSISAILLIILLVIVYNIEAEGQVTTNLTFLSSIVLESQVLQNKQQVINLSKNFQEVYGTTKFQNARLLHRSSLLTSSQIRYNIYSQQDQKLLYLVELELEQDGNVYPVRFAVFMNSQFPLPKDEDFNDGFTYYSFEIKDERKSSLLSLNTNQHLKVYSTNPQIKSIAQCPNYKFQPQNIQRKGSFRLLKDMIHFRFYNPTVSIHTEGWRCFSPQLSSEQELQNILKDILHPSLMNQNVTLSLKTIEAYYLS